VKARGHYYLISHHGTVLYIHSAGSLSLRHASLELASLNLVLEIEDARARLLMVENSASGVRQVSFVRTKGEIHAQSSRTDFDCDIVTFADGSVGIRLRDKYVSANLDGMVRNNRTWCREWERFHLVKAEVAEPEDGTASTAAGPGETPVDDIHPTDKELLRVNIFFKRHHGYYPSLSNPRTFNELIQRRKLFDRKPIYRTFCDKVAVRDYVEQLCGPEILIPSLWVGTDAAAIPFADLPYPIILKPTHLSGRVEVLRRPPNERERLKLIDRLNQDLARTYAIDVVEWGYYQIPRRIIVEPFLSSTDEFPYDYKFYVFHGRAAVIQFDTDRFTNQREAFFDCSWRRLPFRLAGYPEPLVEPERPTDLDRMRLIAEKLSSEFDFLRVDLYNVGNRIYFGEITVYSHSGKRPFHPLEWDYKLGALWLRTAALPDYNL
jgi:hypothetical protein